MDIHRSRFVPFPAAPINAVAFSRTDDVGYPGASVPALRLALGRSNGSIEIWNADKSNWCQEAVVPGGEDRSIEGLAWTQEPDDTDAYGARMVGQLRLFSIGNTASVAEWDLATGKVARQSTGNFSEIWCLASQPRWNTTRDGEAKEDQWTGQDLVIGCGDGSIATLSTADNDLTFKRFLARSGSKKTRCMSLVWQSRERIVAGFSDSNIRVYDARNGTLLRTMSLGAGIPGAPKDTLVWRVKTLPSGDIVSADSNGEVRIWDGRTYSMSQRIAGHESDCLDLVTSADGQTIFSGGIDGRVAVYKLSVARGGDGGGAGGKKRWAKAQHKRLHRGDLKTMAVYDSKGMSVVVTGGADTVPWVLPMRDFGRENARRLPGLPQRQPCVSAADARLLACWWERSVWIWLVGQQQQHQGLGLAPTALEAGKSRKLLSKLEIAGDDDIADVAISRDGRLLVAATTTAVKVFEIRISTSRQLSLRVRSVEVANEVGKEGAKLVAISPDGQWITIINIEDEIKILRVTASDNDSKRLAVRGEVAELERVSRKSASQSGLKGYERTINNIAFSDDSHAFSVSDRSGYVDVYSLQGELDLSLPAATRVQANKTTKIKKRMAADSDSDSSDEDDDDLPILFHGQTWTLHAASHKLPKLDSAPLLISFIPSANPDDRQLLIITQKHQIYEFDLNRGKFSDWSRRNPTGTLPLELRTIKDRVMGLVWNRAAPLSPDPGRQHRAWLYGPSWLAMLDMRQDFATSAAEGTEVALTNGKRKRDAVEEQRWEERRGRKGRGGAGDLSRNDVLGGIAKSVRVADAEGTMETRSLLRRGKGKGQGVGDGDVEMADALDGQAQEGGAGLEEDDVEDEDEDAMPLVRIGADEVEAVGADGASENDDDIGVYEDDEDERMGPKKWWCTYKYRPILGVVPLSRSSGLQDGTALVGAGQEAGVEEVVLIERPVWELEHMRD